MSPHHLPLLVSCPLLFSVLACADGGKEGAGDGGSADAGSADGGGTADGGSADGGTSDGGGVSDLVVSAEIAPDVVTVVRVGWSSSGTGAGHVEFGESVDYGLQTPSLGADGDGEALLLGVPADTDVHFRVVLEDGTQSEDQVIRTGSLPSGLPVLTVSGTADDWGYQVVPLQGTSYAVTIIDPQGRYVWYDQLEAEGNLMRAYITHDRQWMVYCLAGPQADLSRGLIRWVSMDGSQVVEQAFPFVDHDMAELPDGTIAGIVVTDPPHGKGGGEMGNVADRIVELSPDGVQTEIWNAWDVFDFEALGVNEHNLTHGNALDYDPEEDVYYISMKALGSIAKVDRATGETLWVINGRANQFSFPEGDEIVELQHQFELQDGGLLIFDNGPTERGYSRVVELAVDEEAMEAETIWEYIRDPSVYVFAKGDVARFADGTTQVVWSASGEIQNVSPDGDVLWQLNTALGQAITFVHIVDDLYLR